MFHVYLVFKMFQYAQEQKTRLTQDLVEDTTWTGPLR